MSHVIRAARAEDLSAVTRLLQDAHLPVDGLELQFGPAYAVAVANDEVIGAEGMEQYGPVGLLRSAVVDQRFRGQGIGDELTRDRLDWARRTGLDEVWLLTTTASKYFPKFGFSEVARAEAPAGLRESVEFREACPASAVAMRLTFSE